MHLCALRPRLSRAQGAAGESRRPAARDQHALGEEPVPDADQEYLAGPLPAKHLLDHGPGHHRGVVLPDLGALVLAGVLVPGAELAAGDGQAHGDPEKAPRGSCLHRRLVQVLPSQRAGAQESAAAGVALAGGQDLVAGDWWLVAGASPSWARGEYPPTTADSKLSRKSFPSG